MDWDLVIGRNTEALRRILAMLVAMAGLGAVPAFSPCGRRCRGEAETDEGCCEGQRPITLPRRLHRAVLRLLLPLEAATRRLIIVAARDLPEPALPPRRPSQARSALSTGARFVGLGLATCNATPPARPAPRTWSLSMADPPKRFGARRRAVAPHAAPRIWFAGSPAPVPAPKPPSGADPIDATRLALRLAGIGRALADLPEEARRFARWQARRAENLAPSLPSTGRVPREAGRVGCATDRRTSPLRPGRAPGWRRRSADEVQEVLADLHYFAREALARPDTS